MTDNIVGLDFETTGKDAKTCRVVQVAMKKVDVVTREVLREFSTLVNPQVEISPDAIEVHGITPEMVKDAPKFADIMDVVMSFFEDTNVIFGHNVKTFDVPILVNEINRSDPQRKMSSDFFTTIDTLELWNANERRDLSSAYFRFTGEELKDAHDAAVDLDANTVVLNRMIDTFKINRNVDDMIRACYSELYVAGTYHFQWGKAGDVEVCFGKHNGKLLSVVMKGFPDYLNWIIFKSDFQVEVKEFLQSCFKDGIPKREK